MLVARATKPASKHQVRQGGLEDCHVVSSVYGQGRQTPECGGLSANVETSWVIVGRKVERLPA
jgi:hypothetical protein